MEAEIWDRERLRQAQQQTRCVRYVSSIVKVQKYATVFIYKTYHHCSAKLSQMLLQANQIEFFQWSG